MTVSNCRKIIGKSLTMIVLIILASCDMESSPTDSAMKDHLDTRPRYLADFCQHCLKGAALYHCEALAHTGVYDIQGNTIIAEYDECYHTCDSSCMIKLINSLD